MKYAEYLLSKLASEEKYTHCYFVAGGNTMHLLDAARKEFKCIPVVNEVAAGIAAEYFNESNSEGNKAFALVTAGANSSFNLNISIFLFVTFILSILIRVSFVSLRHL